MVQCPVCQTEYLEEQVKNCSTCGWDLTPYPPTFARQVPKTFLEKEGSKIAWTGATSANSESQLSAFQSKLESLNKENKQREHLVTQLQCELEQSRTLLKNANDTIEKINLKLDNIKLEKQKLYLEINKHEQKESHFETELKSIETQLQIAKKCLAQWLPDLTTELSEELAHLNDKSQAKNQIEQLAQTQLIAYRKTFLEIINLTLEIEEEEQIQKITEFLAAIEDNNPIYQVDAVLNARREMKLRGILNRDIDGDILI